MLLKATNLSPSWRADVSSASETNRNPLLSLLHLNCSKLDGPMDCVKMVLRDFREDMTSYRDVPSWSGYGEKHIIITSNNILVTLNLFTLMKHQRMSVVEEIQTRPSWCSSVEFNRSWIYLLMDLQIDNGEHFVNIQYRLDKRCSSGTGL